MKMQDMFGVYAVAAFLIGIMFVLFIDVMRRNHAIVHTFQKEAASAAEKSSIHNEQQNMQVYPPYVDCSRDFSNQYLSNTSAEMDTLVQKQGA